MNREKNATANQFMDFYFSARYFAAVGIGLVSLPIFTLGAEPASDLAAGLRRKQEGSTFVRVRMQIGSGEILQVQIKSRVSPETSDIVYQILFPKERKGESVLLHRSGEKFTGALFTPPNSVRSIAPGQINQPLFGSDLSYEDIIDNPYRWSQQAIVGAEVIDNNPCQILESKPGKGSSSYSSVKTWVDPRRMVPLRIEKYASGKIMRRINTTRILLDGGDSLPADLKVYGPSGAVTEITGSRIKRGVTYGNAEFTPDGLKQLTGPPGSPE
jgi:Outer membrane lipoprotein-sorting protein